ncbi:MAG: hydantoinase B/oxoprolinase family protein [Acidimicrobiales bacterium]
MERPYGRRVRRHRLRRRSGGAGRRPGGERDLEMLQDATVSVISERAVGPVRGASTGATPTRRELAATRRRRVLRRAAPRQVPST